jgi:lysylphosphatidylglycerol synthetase-like protein (DUF2156 family)
MNNTFNLKRFGWYFKKHTIEHGKTYLLTLLVTAGIVFLVLAIPVFIAHGPVTIDWQFRILLTVLWLGGSIFTSTVFADLGDSKKAILPLMLPVSHLEKFLVAWLYTFPIFLLVSTGTFYFVDAIILSMSHPTDGPDKMLNLLNDGTPASLAIILFTLLHMLTFWGAIYFNKLHFIKTGCAFFIVAFAVCVFNYGFLSLISGGQLITRAPIFQTSVIIKNISYTLHISPNILVECWIIFALAVILLWLSAFYKLKEKQV